MSINKLTFIRKLNREVPWYRNLWDSMLMSERSGEPLHRNSYEICWLVRLGRIQMRWWEGMTFMKVHDTYIIIHSIINYRPRARKLGLWFGDIDYSINEMHVRILQRVARRYLAQKHLYAAAEYLSDPHEHGANYQKYANMAWGMCGVRVTIEHDEARYKWSQIDELRGIGILKKDRIISHIDTSIYRNVYIAGDNRSNHRPPQNAKATKTN